MELTSTCRFVDFTDVWLTNQDITDANCMHSSTKATVVVSPYSYSCVADTLLQFSLALFLFSFFLFHLFRPYHIVHITSKHVVSPTATCGYHAATRVAVRNV
jgi:hypothetical protein